MFENIKNVEIVSILDGISRPYRLYEDRATHAFIFRLCGENNYEFSHKRECLHKNEMIFIPKGTTYGVRRNKEEESKYLAVNFEADINDPVPRKYVLDDCMDIEYLSQQLSKLWLDNRPSDHFRCMSIFFELLSAIVIIDNKGYISRDEKTQLSSALEYLTEHIFDSSLRIDDLYYLSNMSDTYFRKLFVAKYGISPKKYIINKRLMRAKALIDSDEYDNIYEVATSVGYDDSLYFSKLFKKKYGLTPTEYRFFLRNKT